MPWVATLFLAPFVDWPKHPKLKRFCAVGALCSGVVDLGVRYDALFGGGGSTSALAVLTLPFITTLSYFAAGGIAAVTARGNK